MLTGRCFGGSCFLQVCRLFEARSRLLRCTPSQLTTQKLRSLFTMSSEPEEPATASSQKELAEDTWKLNYVTGDLFSCPEDEALAHCISEDCRMGAGIAVMFKRKFKGVEELKEQRKQPGQCAVLKRERRFIYYLITKKRASQKPTYQSLQQSLEDMKSHCELNGVTRISMPRIGCGLDRLMWKKVAEILEQVFQHTDICITVYSLPEKAETKVMKEFTHR